MSKESLKRRFPDLFHTSFTVTSDPDDTYNCVAWALHDDTNWWEPHGQAYWPINYKDDSLDGYITMFRAMGFERCSTDEPEEGYEKIAIYVDRDGGFSHVARQIDLEYWTSKCGQADDIFHYLKSLEGDLFGNVKVFMKRCTK